MAASPVDAFVSKLASLDVACERTTADDFGETLASHVDGPAVGVSLRDLDVSLAGTEVTVDPTPAALKAAHTGVTPARFAVADYGSVVIPSTSDGTELVSLFVDRHVAVVDASSVVPGMAAAFERFGAAIRDGTGIGRERPTGNEPIESAAMESGVVATGPSATADMGGLVHGAHGPRDVHVLVVEESDE